MSDQVYKKLATVLDTLPNGYPAAENGVEIEILKMIFSPEDAELFCDMRLSYETPQQIAERTGRPIEGLEEHLRQMCEKGQIFGVDLGEAYLVKMAPWVFGIFEFQLNRMTPELAKLCEEYGDTFGPQFFDNKVQFMNIVPVEEEIASNEVTLPYEQVSAIIENGQSFAVNDCVCKVEHEHLGKPCDRPVEVCLAIAPIPGYFTEDNPQKARPITKEEAYDILKLSEEHGLVHMTSNIEGGHFFICNCCSCCCGVLKGVNEYSGAKAVNSNYYAVIDADECVSCSVCADERCQVFAIEEEDDAYAIIKDKCIGCGLCISTCPSDAISLIRKNKEDIILPPVNEKDWYKKRAEARGVDYSQYA